MNLDPETADLPRLLASSIKRLRNMKANFIALFRESDLRSNISNN